MKISENFRCKAGVYFGENTPKLVEWVNFRNFGFKVNLVTKTLPECTNALPNNVDGVSLLKVLYIGCCIYCSVVPLQREEVQKKY